MLKPWPGAPNGRVASCLQIGRFQTVAQDPSIIFPAAGELRGTFLWQPPCITWIPFPCWLLLLFVLRNSQGLWGMRTYGRRMKENSRATKMTNVGAWTWLQGADRAAPGALILVQPHRMKTDKWGAGRNDKWEKSDASRIKHLIGSEWVKRTVLVRPWQEPLDQSVDVICT